MGVGYGMRGWSVGYGGGVWNEGVECGKWGWGMRWSLGYGGGVWDMGVGYGMRSAISSHLRQFVSFGSKDYQVLEEYIPILSFGFEP